MLRDKMIRKKFWLLKNNLSSYRYPNIDNLNYKTIQK